MVIVMYKINEAILKDVEEVGRNKAFENLYIYLTNVCNYRCKHCYLGNRLNKPEEMNLDKVYEHLETWHSVGSEKICFIGGEPTLYPHLKEAVIRAKALDYKTIIVGSNGSSVAKKVFENLPLEYISYVQISLDGANEDTHDMIREKGAFSSAVSTIEFLKSANVDVRIIMTVNQYNIREVIPMIQFGKKMGVSLVKFHIMSEIGRAHNSMLKAVSPEEWVDCCEKIKKYCQKNLDGDTRVSFQPAYAFRGRTYEQYEGCVGRKLERISVFPDGRCYICSFLFDYDISYAHLDGHEIIKNSYSEFDRFSESRCSKCINKCNYDGCIAETMINGYDFCEKNEKLYPVCRLWKHEIEGKK